MKISQIYEILNELSPFELQEEWDNSGLLVGSFEEDVEKVAKLFKTMGKALNINVYIYSRKVLGPGSRASGEQYGQ